MSTDASDPPVGQMNHHVLWHRVVPAHSGDATTLGATSLKNSDDSIDNDREVLGGFLVVEGAQGDSSSRPVTGAVLG